MKPSNDKETSVRTDLYKTNMPNASTSHRPHIDPTSTSHRPILMSPNILFSSINMPYKHKRDCPVCDKPGLRYMSDHLRQVHHSYGDERKKWFRNLHSAKRATHKVTENHIQE